jgi:uncharacterized phage protein (TIGR01671 family)
MREIKFRAWDKHKKEMYEVPDWDIGTVLNPQCNYIPMQFTGLYDKNGKEIYEGDILNITNRYDDYEIYASIEWDNEEARWGYCKKDGDDVEVGSLYDIGANEYEVIGNIYENPNLIAGEH